MTIQGIRKDIEEWERGQATAEFILRRIRNKINKKISKRSQKTGGKDDKKN